MRRTIIIALLSAAFWVSLAQSQTGYIGLYSDVAYTDPTVTDVPGVTAIYAVLKDVTEASAVRFRVYQSTGCTMTSVGSSSPFTTVIGNPRDGIQIAFGACMSSDVLLLTMNYFSQGTSEDCSFLEVVTDPDASTGQIEGVDCSSSTFSLAGSRLYVNPTGNCPPENPRRVLTQYATIQDAVYAAAPHDTIMLEPGTYTGLGNKQIDFFGKPLVLTSVSGADNTIIDCEEFGRAFHLHSGEDSTVISNVTIRNGRPLDESGGAGIILEGVEVTVRDCIIQGCWTPGHEGGGIKISGGNVSVIDNRLGGVARYGGAVACTDSAIVEIIGNTFTGPHAISYGGGVSSGSPWVNIRRNTFSSCSSEGAGGAISGVAGTIENNLFEWNDAQIYGGAVEGGCDSLINNVFRGNSAGQPGPYGYGGAIHGSVDYMAGNEFDENDAYWGAAIAGSVVQMDNNLFHNNYGFFGTVFHPDYYGAGNIESATNNTIANNTVMSGNAYIVSIDTMVIANTIISGTHTFFSTSTPGLIKLSCSDLYATGIPVDPASFVDLGGNIYADPEFCDPAGDDYTLKSSSPCLSASCGVIGAFGQGCWGAAPGIFAVNDVGNDQGRQVRLSWLRSDHDVPGTSPLVTGYAVYRRQDASSSSSENSSVRTDDALSGAPALSGWDYIATHPARGDSVYQLLAPTLCDSTVFDDVCWSTFMVSALTDDQFVYFDSAPDSGYSVDNIAPLAPSGLMAAYNTGVGTVLDWNEATETDFYLFRVYRGNTPDFVPEPADIVHETSSESWADDVAEGWKYSYKVSAVDFSGNESPIVKPDPLVAVEDETVPRKTALYQNVPNPFNPITRIGFSVAEAGRVELAIYDATGALVRVLVDRRMGPTTESVVWDGTDRTGNGVSSGVYFYRLKINGFTETKKMVLLR